MSEKATNFEHFWKQIERNSFIHLRAGQSENSGCAKEPKTEKDSQRKPEHTATGQRGAVQRPS